MAYRIEARDNDAFSGSKTGSSRTLYVVIADPRENLDEQLLREREVLDRLLDNLADRLEALDGDEEPPARWPSARPPAGQPGLDAWLGGATSSPSGCRCTRPRSHTSRPWDG